MIRLPALLIPNEEPVLLEYIYNKYWVAILH